MAIRKIFITIISVLFIMCFYTVLSQKVSAATYIMRADGTATWKIISSWTNDGGLFRATTTTSHGFSNGDTVSISGTALVNGTWTVSNVDATHFTLSNGPTYQVGALGTRVIAAGPASEASKTMSISAHNTNDLLKPGDIIYLSSQGGNYTATISAPSSGTISSPIIYSPAPSETVTFTGAAGLFNITTKSYVTVDGLNRFNLNGGASYAFLVSGCTGCVVKNLSINTTVSNGLFWTNSTGTVSDASAKAAAFGFRFATSSAVTLTNLSVTSSNGTAFFFDSSNINATGLVATNVQNHGAQIRGTNNMTVTGTDWTFTNVGLAVSTNDGINFDGNSASNITLNLTDYSLNDSGGQGFWVFNGTFNAASKLDGFSILNAGAHGIRLQNSPNLQLINGSVSNSLFDGANIDNSSNTIVRNNVISYNAQDGVSTLNNAANVIVEFNDIHHNGANSTGNGDGVTAHTGCTNMQVNYNLIHHNWNAGFALTLTSGGSAYNNVVYSNGFLNTVDIRGGWYQSGTSSWTQKNNIFYGNYPYELNIATTNTLVASNNHYYHPVGFNGISNESTAFTRNTGSTQLSWASYSSNETNSIYGDPLFVNAASNDFSLQTSSLAIDTGVVISGLVEDFIGNVFYGLPDMGSYEFQPPYTMSTHEIDIDGDIKIYSDGKFRNTQSPSGTTANLSITPNGGFSGGDRSEWMNVVISQWINSGNYNKVFTTTLETAETVDYVIADLQASTTFLLRIDGGAWSEYTSNSSGEINLEYIQDDQVTQIELIKDITPPAGTITINAGASTTATASVTLNLSISDDFDTQPDLQMIVSNFSDFSGASYEVFNTSKSWTLTTGYGTKTVYAKFKDQMGNESIVYSDTISYPEPALNPPTAPSMTPPPSSQTTTTKPPVVSYPLSNVEDISVTIPDEQKIIRLQIVDEDKNPLENVGVRISELGINGMTDENGYINLGYLQAGSYDIEVDYNGKTTKKTIEVSNSSAELVLGIDTKRNGSNNIGAIVIIGLILVGLAAFIKAKKPQRQN